MFLFVFIIGLLVTPISGQDENSEDAFEIRRDSSQENEGMDTFVMSTAILEQEPVKITTVATERIMTTKQPEESMEEDPFEMPSSQSGVESKILEPSPSEVVSMVTVTPVVPMETSSPIIPIEMTTEELPDPSKSPEESSTMTFSSIATTPATTEIIEASSLQPEIVSTTEKNIDITTEAVETSIETLDETVPTVADVWTTSTETAERRVLKEKSEEELVKFLPSSTTTTTTTTEEPLKSEEMEEAPFDSSNLGGLFESDGSPKVEPSPTFPMAHLPIEQEEESEEILEKERRISTTTAETTTVHQETLPVEATRGTLPSESTSSRPEISSTSMDITKQPSTTPRLLEEKKPPIMMRPMRLIPTTLTLKIISIEWMDDFANQTSGKYRKLSEQILPELNALLKKELGDDFVSVDIDNFTKGSVVVNAIMHTREAIVDPEQVATRLETVITMNGKQLGSNQIDPASITVNGIPSRAYLDRVNAAYAPSSISPLLVAAIVAVSSVLIILLIIIICLVNNRRSHGGMKMPIAEEGTMRSIPQLNLMSYATSTRNTGPPPSNEREIV